MIYIINDGSEWVKIGKTTNLNQRIMELQIGNPRTLVVLKTFEIKNLLMPDVKNVSDTFFENRLHVHYSEYKSKASKRSEWFLRSAVEPLLTMSEDETNAFFRQISGNENSLVFPKEDVWTDVQAMEKINALEAQISELEKQLSDFKKGVWIDGKSYRCDG